MASPVDFEGANSVMHAPKGKEDEVVDLPVFIHESGMSFAVLLDEKERQKVSETGVVWVNIMSHSMPPIAVSGHSQVIVVDEHGNKRDARVVPLPIQNKKTR